MRRLRLLPGTSSITFHLYKRHVPIIYANATRHLQFFSMWTNAKTTELNIHEDGMVHHPQDPEYPTIQSFFKPF